MHITWTELTVTFEKRSASVLIEDWRWLLGNSMTLLLVSSIGDMFLSDGSGLVFWLDVGTGQLQKIANSADEFKRLIQKREQLDQWFIPRLVGDLITHGVRLSPGQCYSYKKPPFLGGKVTLDNFEPTDLSVHFSILGQLYRKVQNLPPGTKVSGIEMRKR